MSDVFGARSKPTRHELLKLRKRLSLARRAHKLLEEKYKILSLEREKMRMILDPFEEKMSRDLGEAYKLLLEALRHSGLRRTTMAGALCEANDDFSVSWVTLHGLTAPRFHSNVRRRNALQRGYGLSATDPWIDEAASAFEETLELLVSVAETRNLFRVISEEAEKTHVRVVALERFLIPRLVRDVRRIELSLQERDLEQFIIQRWIKESEAVHGEARSAVS